MFFLIILKVLYILVCTIKIFWIELNLYFKTPAQNIISRKNKNHFKIKITLSPLELYKYYYQPLRKIRLS